METFRKLANSIFFKIVLAFVALSFVLFGVSNFILGNPNTWVAKIGDESVSYNRFNSALKADREIVVASAGTGEDVAKYLESDRFKSDVLGRIVNQSMVKKLSKDFEVSASKKIILESVAKDPSFKNESGKFDHKKFEVFLKKNGLNEERYIAEISSNVSAAMVLQSFPIVAPVSDEVIVRTEKFKQEKRVADVISISEKDVAKIANPSGEELEKFFQENKAQYVTPERRKVSYLTFSKKDFADDFKISDQEILAEYEKNKDQYLKPETRNFYNVVFDKEEDAKNFLAKFEEAIKSEKSKAKASFEKLAKELAKKDLKGISLANLSKKDLLPQIADSVFSLEIDAHSPVVSSPLGFHVFLLNEIKKSQPMTFAEVKDGLKLKLASGREEKVVQEKISAIDDLLLTSNSLSEVAKKFNLKSISAPIAIDQKGSGASVVKDLNGFVESAFSLKEKQASKVFASNKGDFYAVFVEEIIPAKQLEFAEAKSQVTSDLLSSKRQEALRELARKVGDEIKKNPNSIADIAAKNHLNLSKSQEFPRVLYLNFQGQKFPYQDQLIKDLFSIKVGEATPVAAQAENKFVIAVLREVKKANLNSAQIEQIRAQAKDELRNEIMSDFNSYLLSRYPVKTNDKVFGAPSKEAK